MRLPGSGIDGGLLDRSAGQTLPPHLAATPKIVNFTIPQDDWSALGELAVPARG